MATKKPKIIGKIIGGKFVSADNLSEDVLNTPSSSIDAGNAFKSRLSDIANQQNGINPEQSSSGNIFMQHLNAIAEQQQLPQDQQLYNQWQDIQQKRQQSIAPQYVADQFKLPAQPEPTFFQKLGGFMNTQKDNVAWGMKNPGAVANELPFMSKQDTSNIPQPVSINVSPFGNDGRSFLQTLKDVPTDAIRKVKSLDKWATKQLFAIANIGMGDDIQRAKDAGNTQLADNLQKHLDSIDTQTNPQTEAEKGDFKLFDVMYMITPVGEEKAYAKLITKANDAEKAFQVTKILGIESNPEIIKNIINIKNEDEAKAFINVYKKATNAGVANQVEKSLSPEEITQGKSVEGQLPSPTQNIPVNNKLPLENSSYTQGVAQGGKNVNIFKNVAQATKAQDEKLMLELEQQKEAISNLVNKGVATIDDTAEIDNTIQKLATNKPITNAERQNAYELIQHAKTSEIPKPVIPKVEVPDVPLPKADFPQPFDAGKYVQEQVAAREGARQAEKGTVMQRLTKIKDQFMSNWSNDEHYIKKPFENAVKNGADIPAENNIMYQMSKVQRSSGVAERFAKDKGFTDIVEGLGSKRNADEFEQYVIAKHAQDLAKNGVTTGRDAAKDEALVNALSSKWEGQAQALNKYSHDLLDYSVEKGLISKEVAAELKVKYPNYVPFNRVFGEGELPSFLSKGGGKASISGQSIVQKIKGSERQVESPLASLWEKTLDAHRQGEINDAGKMLASYHTLPGNPFQLEALRTAENVQKRIGIFGELKTLFADTRGFAKEGKGVNKEIKLAETKFNKIFNQDESSAIKNLGTEYAKTNKEFGKLVDIAQSHAADLESESKINAILDKAVTRERKMHKLNGELVDAIATFNKQKEANVADSFQTLKDIKLKRKALDVLIDERKAAISELRGELSGIGDIAKKPADNTITFFNNGIKEVWKTTPEIAKVAKNLDNFDIGLIGKIFNAPLRVFKVGTTGIRTSFALANLAKDQVTAFINAKAGLRGSLINPKNFMSAFWNSIGKGEFAKEMERAGAMGTSFDQYRGAGVKTIEQIRAGRNIATNAAYKITHPAQLFRAVEDIIAVTEKLTRFQYAKAAKVKFLKEGYTEAEATLKAANEFRTVSVDFFKGGSYTKALNGVVAYLNAGVRGSATLLKNLKERPVTTTAKIVASTFMPMAYVTMHNLNDPERKAAYDDIPDFEKEGNIIIIPPHPTKDPETGKWNVIKVPMSQEVANLANIVRNSVENAYGYDNLKMKKIAQDLFNTATSLDFSTPEKTASTLTPQAIKPGLQAFTNKNFYTGFPEVPQSMQGLSPENQVKDNTSGTARIIGNKLGVSPIKTEAFIRDTFGGASDQAINAIDTGLNKAGVIPKEQIGGKGMLQDINSRFTEASGGAINKKQEEQLQGLVMNQADDRFKINQKAEQLYAEWKKLPQKEAYQKFEELNKTDKATAERMKTVVQDDKLGLNYAERLINQLGVTNGERAKFVYEEAKKYKTSEERNKYLADLYDKKIVTPEVVKQLKYLVDNNQ